MTGLKLISSSNRQLKPLVEAALANEIRLLQAGQLKTEARLRDFEEKHKMKTEEFITHYENDELEETMDFAEWIGEFRMLERLREKVDTLRDIRFAN
ncbi:MAG: hypothetical protein JW882_17165 [Deltaproteobacteria bacterium]|nr:hypothetical protein [Deltaproteobacteria bacterium]